MFCNTSSLARHTGTLTSVWSHDDMQGMNVPIHVLDMLNCVKSYFLRFHLHTTVTVLEHGAKVPLATTSLRAFSNQKTWRLVLHATFSGLCTKLIYADGIFEFLFLDFPVIEHIANLRFLTTVSCSCSLTFKVRFKLYFPNI